MMPTSSARTFATPACPGRRCPGLGRIGGTTLALALGLLNAAPARPAPVDLAYYEAEVRPILVKHCYSCHSAEARRLKGGLHLDSREGWLRGGDLGPSVHPGDPAESLLITAVRYDDEGLRMPPRGKLTDREIDVLTRWVKEGAPGPAAGTAPVAEKRAADPAQARDFWAFRPPTDPPAPSVTDGSWPRSEIDRFLLAALEAKGLKPAPEADRRTLIRRATFDLTGLPPTPEEVEAFVNDRSPDAFARVVDRLLASSRYGERWGRHWLDVARYADSNGLDENVAHGNAWRYRDYVIASFNADKPYDRFLVEQLAGDLLPDDGAPGQAHERLIATGFLALGPKVLAEVDEKKMEMDIVDEQIDTVGRAFLGLTLGCARCHDHKFDPIPTADYYGLAGIFKSTRTMETFAKVARWYEVSLAGPDDLARQAAHGRAVAAKKKAIEAAVTAANKALRAANGKGFVPPKNPEPLYPDATKAGLKALRAELASLEAAAPEPPAAMGVTEGKVADTFVHVRGSHLTPGPVVPRHVPAVLVTSDAPSFSGAASGRRELAEWLTRGDHPLTSRVMVNRVWRWHFGRGLVGTPDNFGLLGERPTHPELLDWLARRFVADGWSVKALHRRIMLSSAYRMSSAHDPDAARVDPENRLLWRANVRRLEAEAIRDALLAVGGTLDERMGGSTIQVKNRAYFFDHTSRDLTDYDIPRRSVYLPVVRNHLYDVFELFDYADASVSRGDRPTTTVAPQALFMMNSELVLNAARGLATDLFERKDLDDPGRLSLLYRTAYGRPATPAESARAVASLDRFERTLHDDGPGRDAGALRREAWEALCQVVLAANEFIFVR